MKAVTAHAKARALERWGFELTDTQWIALAKSIRAGAHRFVRRQPGGARQYRVILLREDGSTLHVPFVVARNGTIITVPPRQHR